MSLDAQQLIDFKNSFNQERKNFRRLVVDNGVDKVVDQIIKDLQDQVRETYDARVGIDDIESPRDERNIAQPKENATASDTSILKQLTGVKNTQFSKNYQDVEDGILYVQKDQKVGPSSARVEFTIPHELIDDLESQYTKASDIFKKTPIAIPNGRGGFDYYQNTGQDLTQHLKIKCSKYTGTHDESPYGGNSPQKRFQLDQDQGYSTWTLKQSFINQVPNNPNFIHLNPIIDKIKKGDPELAQGAAKTIRNQEVREKLETEIKNFEEGKNLSPSAENINQMMDLINKLSIEKDIRDTVTIYKVVTTDLAGMTQDFLKEVQRYMVFWKTSSVPDLFKALDKKINTFISRL